MSVSKQKNPLEKSSIPKLDFTQVGGLSNHIKTLRDIVIFPLIHYNIYSHFSIKVPRGVLFYGPPGTGKTLVAGALANEINKAVAVNVSFYQRKGADVLDKWIGESEKKLRDLFETAKKTRPSIIFFDELDGLAPIRTSRNDHIHCSIVTTLLTMMDSLDTSPGVIVIGATNRIETLDPALRRPGRFDRELYFPLPSTQGRKDILQVHTHTWHCQPSVQFITLLAESTPGFCGADLQALCAEAVLCCAKRLYPSLDKGVVGKRVRLRASDIEVEERDFLAARMNVTPSGNKVGYGMRKLNTIVRPILQKQLDLILKDVKLTWPHFFMQFYKYPMSDKKYAGRLILIGSNSQGVNTHLIPAILQNFEHLPHYVLEIKSLSDTNDFIQNVPFILVVPQIDEFWDFLSASDQIHIAQTLQKIHSKLPILVIASCNKDIPLMLQNFFFNNTTVIRNIENPTSAEIEQFFFPLFFSNTINSLRGILTDNCGVCLRNGKKQYKKHRTIKAGRVQKKKSHLLSEQNRHSVESCVRSNPSHSNFLNTVNLKTNKFLMILSNLLFRKTVNSRPKGSDCSKSINVKRLSWGDAQDVDRQRILDLWHRTITLAQNMDVTQLEIVYDAIATSIRLNRTNFQNLTEDLAKLLNDIEVSIKNS